MASTEIKGKVVKVPQPAYVLYNGFADLRNFTMALPPDKKESVIATADTIEGEVQGVKMGLQVAKRYPFSCISYSQYGNTPFSFNVAAFFNAIDSTNTELMTVEQVKEKLLSLSYIQNELANWGK
mgnify:CR=1 FL=1